MKLLIPKFWIERNFISLILFPLSLITLLINKLKHLSSKYNPNIKTICIGNIYIGGTGKTTLSIEINRILKKKSVFIKKDYKEQNDEISLLKKKGKIIKSKNRIDALNISAKKKFKIAILDDGLQQKNINYSLKIVCFNSTQGIGNGFVFPAGPLRESIEELKKYDIAFLNGEKKNKKLYKKIKSINKNIRIFESVYEPKNLNEFNLKKKFLMFCGIGNPQEFENTLSKYKFKIKKKIFFPDHYNLSIKELNKIKKLAKKEALSIITTEKDYLRLRKQDQKNINYLKIKLKIYKLSKLKKILIRYI